MEGIKHQRHGKTKSDTKKHRHPRPRNGNNDKRDSSPQHPKEPSTHDATATRRTKWSYYHDGNVEVPEICVYSIDKRCKFEEKGCERLHAKCTSQWQIMQGTNWFNFRNFHSKDLEDAFEDVTKNGVQLSSIDPVKLGPAGSEMFKILGNDQWEADFEKMLLANKNSVSISHKIRRLSTQSSALSKSAKATTYVWYFQDINNKWIKYGETDSTGDHSASTITSDDIEKQYVTDKSVPLSFSTSQFQYSLNLETMQQINLKTNKVRSIRRRPIKKLSTKPIAKGSKSKNGDLPVHWNEMKDTDTMLLVALESSTREYKDVMEQLLLTLPNIKVLSLKRVQNPFLWRPFQNKQNEISIKYGGNDKLNIQKLFHGTKKEYVTSICKENFDWRLHGSNVGQLYGRGTYFSNSAAYSKSYCTPDSSGQSFMLVAEVIIGEITGGNSSMARPPMNPSTGELFDTTVDSTSSPKIFVKYDKQEYCPIYAVEFM